MKFGIFDHLDRRDQPLPDFYAERLKFLAAADEAGFHAYHVAEHHSAPIGMAPSPSLFLAAVAQHTKRMRLGPLVYLLPFYHPLRLIEEVCMLDNISGGRLEMGVGRGISPFESGFFGVDTIESGFRFAEALGVLLQGLTSERLTHRGDFYQLNGVPMELQPVQKPYPPLWYAIAGERSQIIAAEYGMNVVGLGANDFVKNIVVSFKERWEEYKDSPHRATSPVTDPLIGATRPILVAETDAEAEKLARPAYDHWYGNLTHLAGTFGFRQTFAVGDFDQALRLGAAIVGSPERVKAALAAQIEECGFNYVVAQLAFGSLSHETEMRSLKLFADEVMPGFS